MLDTLENVKSRLGIEGTDYDTFLTAQIGLVSDTIEAYCRRKFNQATWEQTFYRGDYKLSRMMELFYFPLISVASVVEDSVVRDNTTYRIHKPTGKIILTPGLWSAPFFQADQTVVTFDAGFSAVPSPVLSVLDSVVEERYNKETSGVNLNFGSDVQSIAIPGSLSIAFDYTLNNNDRSSAFGVILGNNLNILDSYRTERTVLGSGKLEYIEASV